MFNLFIFNYQSNGFVLQNKGNCERKYIDFQFQNEN